MHMYKLHAATGSTNKMEPVTCLIISNNFEIRKW